MPYRKPALIVAVLSILFTCYSCQSWGRFWEEEPDDPSGNEPYAATNGALWARSVSAGTYASYFNGVATDANANIYAAGIQNEASEHDYGNGVTSSGVYVSLGTGANAVLVKYK